MMSDVSSYQKLNDETFPASLLMEFDELDDEIPISPPKIVEPESTAAAPPEPHSPVAVSQTSNSSSGNYSLSTENDNGSGSSNFSNPSYKGHSSTRKRAAQVKDAKQFSERPSSSTSTIAIHTPGKKKRAKSLENLTHSTILHQTTSSVVKQQKYGHVKSKVKQYIDETLSQRTRHSLTRYKSMPESAVTQATQQVTEIELEEDANVLRQMLKETSNEICTLQRHLEFTEMLRKDDIAKIATLKSKIEAMRLEHSKRERELQRDREMDKERERQLILATYLRYGGDASFNRVFASVSTQTSPEATHTTFNISTFRSDESFERLLANNFSVQPGSSTGPRVKRALQYAPSVESIGPLNEESIIANPASAQPESSPEYPQLLPVAGATFRCPPNEQRSEARTELLTQDNAEMCNECARKKEKKRNTKTRLASLFCIRKVD